MDENLGTTEATTTTETGSPEETGDPGNVVSGEGGEETGGEVAQPPKQADPDHPANLGRKVKALSEQFESLQQSIANMTEMIREQRTSQQADQPTGEVSDSYGKALFKEMNKIEPCPIQTVVTPEDQWLVNQWEKRTLGKIIPEKRAQAQSAYEKGYFKKLEDPELKELAGDLHARVIQLVTNPKDKGERYNKVITGKPLIDAEMNYLKALNDLRAGKSVGEDLSTFNKGNPEGSGVTVPSGGTKKNLPSAKLSKEAQEYADYLGWSPEQRAEAMTRKISGVGGAI